MFGGTLFYTDNFKTHRTTFCIHVTHFFEVKSLSENKAEDTLQIYSGQSEENGLKYWSRYQEMPIPD